MIYRVGQRVRIVQSDVNPELRGKETIITGPLKRRVSMIYGSWDGYDVAIDPFF